jgi:hypothetical protein
MPLKRRVPGEENREMEIQSKRPGERRKNQENIPGTRPKGASAACLGICVSCRNNPLRSPSANLAPAAGAFEFVHGALHLFAGGVGGRADALDAEAEVIWVRGAHKSFFERHQIA